MPNEFVARNGVLAQNNSQITGSLNVSQGITGSLLGTATTASSISRLNQDVIITGSANITGSFTVNTTGTEFQVLPGGVTIGNAQTDLHNITGSFRITGSLSSIGGFAITNDISASNSSRLSFGSNLFLQTSGSTTSHALEIRPYGLNNNTNSYLFVQPQNLGFGRSMTFDQNNASITILSGNSDGGIVLSRVFGGEFRLASNNPFGGLGFMTFYTGGSEKARINGSGSLLVGTTTTTGHATIINGTNTANFPSGALYVNGSSSFTSSINVLGNLNITGSSSFTGSLNLSGSLTVTTIGIELQVTNTGVKIGNMPTDTHLMTGSLNISGSVNISNVLQLSPLNPLPAAASFPNSFAVSASAPNKPYFSDGTNWNALY